MSIAIPLMGVAADGAYAYVDAEDAELVGSYRWHLTAGGYARAYARRNDRPASIYMHRLVMGLDYGDGLAVDHINRARLDNRKANLRIATYAENQQNLQSRSGASSPFRGVHWYKPYGKWAVSVHVGGRTRHFGYFESHLAAAKAAEAARREHMPFAQPDEALSAYIAMAEAGRPEDFYGHRAAESFLAPRSATRPPKVQHPKPQEAEAA